MKIVILDAHCANPGDLSWEPLKQFGELIVYPRTVASDVAKRIDDAEIILINKILMTEQVFNDIIENQIDKYGKQLLRYIGILATGYNIVDLEAAKAKDIIVTNIPAYSSDSVAQMTFAHILNITNRVEHYAMQNRNGRWSNNPDFSYSDTPLNEIAGKTIGIVGLGSIGKKVAKIARTFGMDVFAMTSKNSADLPEGIQKTTFEGLLAVSDILTLHCPLTATTQEMINKETLAKMKKGAILINTGRGQLVNENDVAEALASGQLSGYGADVMCQEPPAISNTLLSQPNAFITPHIAWATIEARTRLVDIAIRNVEAFIAGTPQNVVS